MLHWPWRFSIAVFMGWCEKFLHSWRNGTTGRSRGYFRLVVSLRRIHWNEGTLIRVRLICASLVISEKWMKQFFVYWYFFMKSKSPLEIKEKPRLSTADQQRIRVTCSKDVFFTVDETLIHYYTLETNWIT